MSVTQYIGSRYVPVFADPAEWNASRTYEPLTIVLHEGNSYTSKQFVPVGIDITNENFWVETGNYNAQVEEYKKEVKRFANSNQPAILSYDTLQDAKTAASTTECINLGKVITIDNRTYVVSNVAPNNMDNLRLTDNLTASLVFEKFLSPEDLQYNTNIVDAAPYINRCLELCRNSATVVLAHTYHIITTVHMSYADNIYTVGTAAIETDVSPAISFDIEYLTQDKRMRSPFIGNTLRIYSANRHLHNDISYVGLELKNAAEIEISNLSIYYMGSAVHITGDNNYCITFRHCLIERNYYGILYDAVHNSSEKIAFQDCVFGHEYVAFCSNRETSSIQFANTSFDFCNCGFYETAAGVSVVNISFISCHIEGLGYYGPDMPKIKSDYYANLIYCTENKYVRHKYCFIGCMFNVSKMQDELGLPLIVNDTRSITMIKSCTLSSKVIQTNTKYPISNGYCDNGIYNDARCFYVGSRIIPQIAINGVYADVTDNDITLTYNNYADTDFKQIFNHPYLIFPQTHHFLIDATFNDSSINYNTTYSDNISGLHEITLSKPTIIAKVSLNNPGSKVIIRGVYPLE